MTISTQLARDAELAGAWRERAIRAEVRLRELGAALDMAEARITELERLLDGAHLAPADGGGGER